MTIIRVDTGIVIKQKTKNYTTYLLVLDVNPNEKYDNYPVEGVDAKGNYHLVKCIKDIVQPNFKDYTGMTLNWFIPKRPSESHGKTYEFMELKEAMLDFL